MKVSSKGFIVRIVLVDVVKDLRPERSFAEALMRLKRFLPPVGPASLVSAYIVQSNRLLAEYTREKGLHIMGEFAQEVEAARTPFGEKELFLEEDVIFYTLGVRQQTEGSKWFIDVKTEEPCTCYGTWEMQSNGMKKLNRATLSKEEFTLSFVSNPFRDKVMLILKMKVEAHNNHYGPMRLVKKGRSIDPSDADDIVSPLQLRLEETGVNDE